MKQEAPFLSWDNIVEGAHGLVCPSMHSSVHHTVEVSMHLLPNHSLHWPETWGLHSLWDSPYPFYFWPCFTQSPLWSKSDGGQVSTGILFHINFFSWSNMSLYLLYPPLQRSWKRGILLSPCPSLRLSVCPSVDKIVSALYLQQYSSDPFHICTSYQATAEGVSRLRSVSKFKNWNFGKLFIFVTLILFSFELGSNTSQ